MPRYLYPGVYVEEVGTGGKPIPGVSTTVDSAALTSIGAELQRTVKIYAPGWTDLNESDPGVTLLELFAFLAESLLGRANEIPERARIPARRAAAALAALGQATGLGCEGLTRPHYFSGQLLDAATLTAEQDYHREKRRRHNRELLGYGIVSGLGVRVESAPDPAGSRIAVDPGYAIDRDGEEICLPRAVTLPVPASGEAVFVTVRFWERACPPSKVEEACVIGLSPAVASAAIPLARLLSSDGSWRVDPQFAPPRVVSGRG